MKKIFRGISISTNKWVAGSLYTGITSEGLIYHAILTMTKAEPDCSLGTSSCVVFSNDEFIPIRKDTEGQYLLDDKDDMPIYEGDIVLQEYSIKNVRKPESQENEEPETSGYFLGIARLTAGGAILTSLKHFGKDGNLSECQPHKNKKIQIRTYRCKLMGNMHEHPHLMDLTSVQVQQL